MSWIETKAYFRNDEYSDEVFDDFTPEQQRELLNLREFRFRKDEVVIYNEAKYGGTTLRFKNDYCITVEMTIKEADKIFIL